MFTEQEYESGARVTVIGPSTLSGLFDNDVQEALRFAAQFPLAARFGHALAGPEVTDVGLELGDHCQGLQEQPSERRFQDGQQLRQATTAEPSATASRDP
jgi:hypothetical protein